MYECNWYSKIDKKKVSPTKNNLKKKELGFRENNLIVHLDNRKCPRLLRNYDREEIKVVKPSECIRSLFKAFKTNFGRVPLPNLCKAYEGFFQRVESFPQCMLPIPKIILKIKIPVNIICL